MQNNIIVALLLSAILIPSCKKVEKEHKPAPPSWKLTKTINYYSPGNEHDTVYYDIQDERISINRVEDNYTSGEIYTKNGNKYSVVYTLQNVTTHTGEYLLNEQGYLESGRINRINNEVNNTSTYIYDSKGYLKMQTNNYITYQNTSYYFWANGNIQTKIYEYINYSDPTKNYRDSVAIEYTEILNNPIYTVPLMNLEGIQKKNLVKQAIIYNSQNVAYKKETYEYVTNSDGLLIQKTSKFYDLINNNLTREYITYYYYEKL